MKKLLLQLKSALLLPMLFLFLMAMSMTGMAQDVTTSTSTETISTTAVAKVWTDKTDYAPGQTALIYGTGFVPGEEVVLLIEHIEPNMPDPLHLHAAWGVVADSEGNFTSTWYVDAIELNTTLYLTADGDLGSYAVTTFTDGSNSWNGSVSTDWNTAGNWTGGLPGNGDDVTIPTSPTSGRMPSISGTLNNSTIKSLTIATGATLTQTGGTLSVTGVTSITGTFTQSGGTFSTSSNVNLNGTINQSGTGLIDMPTKDLNINSGGNFNQDGGTTSVKGLNRVQVGGTYTQSGSTSLLKISESTAGDIRIDGTFTSSGGTVEIFSKTGGNAFNSSGSVTFFNVKFSGGAREITYAAAIYVKGDFINNGGITTTANFGVVFNGTTQSISGSSTTAFNTLTIANGSTVTGNSYSTAVTANINNGGKYIQTTGTTMLGSTTKNFVSGSTYELQTASATFSGSTYGNLIINFAGSTGINTFGVLTTVLNDLDIKNTGTSAFRLSASQSPTVNISGKLIIEGGNVEASTTTGVPIINVTGNFEQSGGNFKLSTSSTGGQALNITGNVILSGGVFQPMGSTGIPTISVKGNWTNNGGTFTPGTGIVTFNNTSADQNIDGTAASQSFNKITVAKSSTKLVIGGSTTTVTLGGTSPALTMTSGNIDLGTGGMLELGTSSGAGTLNYTAGTIINGTNGGFKRWISTTGANDFPMGTSSTKYLAKVTFNNLTAGSLTARFITGDPGSTGLPINDGTFSVENQFTEGYWSLVAANSLTSNNYALELTGTGFSSQTFDANTRIIKRPDAGENWTVNGTHVAAASPVAKRSGLSGFSQFALAAASSCPTAISAPTPATQSVCSNNAIGQLSVTATGGTSANKFQWYSNTTGSTDPATSTLIAGAELNTFTPSPTATPGTTYYFCVLSKPGCTSTFNSGTASVTVNPLPTLSINDVTVNEADGNATFTVTLSAMAECDVTFDASTSNNTAVAGSDYTAIAATPYTIPKGSTTKAISVTINNDNVLEGDESFYVNLTNAVNASFIKAQGIGTINNDDHAAVTIADASGAEDAGAVTFTATLDYAVQGGFTVNVNTADGSATIVDGDYTAVSGNTLTFAGTALETHTFTVLPTVDTKLEANETVGISMNTLAGTTLAVDITDGATLTINNDDEAKLSIVANDANAGEPNNNGQFTVTQSNPADVATVIGYTVSGSATSGSDYTALLGTVTIPVNAITATINVNVIDNLVTESNETVIVTLTSITTGHPQVSIDETKNEATVNITDNDVSLTLNSPAASSGQYSDEIELNATLLYLGDKAFSGQTITFKVGTQTFNVPTDPDGVASKIVQLNQDPNLSPNEMVVATFEANAIPIDGIIYEKKVASKPFDIVKEDARVAYTGDVIKATASTSAYSAEMTLRANIIDFTDGSRGDIRNAKVMFVDREAANAPLSGWLPVSTLVDGSGFIGTVSQTITVSGLSSTTPYKFMTIGIIVDNGYYIRNSMDDDVVITVYTPVDDFITGGGHITVRDESAGTFKLDVGSKVNFGFNVGYKNKNTIGGNMNIILRRTEADGLVHNYQVKANAMTSLGVNASNPASQTAEYLAKANMKDVSGLSTTYSGTGNKDLYVKITDNGEPGANDLISFVLVEMGADPTVLGNILFSSNWVNSNTEKVNLDGGNTVVHSGFIGFNNVLTSSKNPSSVGEAVTFTATVYNGVSGKTVTFKDDTGTLGTSILNSSGIATFTTATTGLQSLTAGLHNMTAIYDGTVASAILVQDVKVGVGVILTSSNNPSVLNDAVIFTATVTGGTDGKTVEFKDGSASLGTSVVAGGIAKFASSTLAVGSHNITAVYDDGVATLVSSNVLVQQVNNRGLVVVLTSSKNPSSVTESVIFTATVTGGTNGKLVKFYDGSSDLTPTAISLNAGKATFTTSALAEGSHSIKAVYDGTLTSSILTQVVSQLTVTLVSSKNPQLPNTSVTFTATVAGTGGFTPTGTVTFKKNGTPIGNTGIVTLSIGKASIATNFPLGSYSITAAYSGTGQTATLTQSILSKIPKVAEIVEMGTPVAVEPTLKAYPNPFTERLNIEFSSSIDTQALLEIYSITGAKLETLFNGPVEKGVVYFAEYVPRMVSSQMVIYRLTMNGKTQVGKMLYNERR